METEKLCDDNVIVFRNFLSQDEADLLTKWFREFNYNGLPKHTFKFWDQRLMTPSLTTKYAGFENSFDEIMNLNNELQERLKVALNMIEEAPWTPSPFNYIKMWKDSNPLNTDYGNDLEMFYHVDNQDHMMQTIFWGMVIYPNDNYEGGEIEYPQYNFKYKPEARSMIVHEGYTMHGVKSVTLGERFCLASLTTKQGVWNPNPKPTPTGTTENPWHYPKGYNGVRMPSDPIQGVVSVPRPDGSLAPFKDYPDPAARDSIDSLNRPGDTKKIK